MPGRTPCGVTTGNDTADADTTTDEALSEPGAIVPGIGLRLPAAGNGPSIPAASSAAYGDGRITVASDEAGLGGSSWSAGAADGAGAGADALTGGIEGVVAADAGGTDGAGAGAADGRGGAIAAGALAAIGGAIVPTRPRAGEGCEGCGTGAALDGIGAGGTDAAAIARFMLFENTIVLSSSSM